MNEVKTTKKTKTVGVDTFGHTEVKYFWKGLEVRFTLAQAVFGLPADSASIDFYAADGDGHTLTGQNHPFQTVAKVVELAGEVAAEYGLTWFQTQPACKVRDALYKRAATRKGWKIDYLDVAETCLIFEK